MSLAEDIQTYAELLISEEKLIRWTNWDADPPAEAVDEERLAAACELVAGRIEVRTGVSAASPYRPAQLELALQMLKRMLANNLTAADTEPGVLTEEALEARLTTLAGLMNAEA